MIDTIDYWNSGDIRGFFRSDADSPEALPWDNLDICIDNLIDSLLSAGVPLQELPKQRIRVYDDEEDRTPMAIVEVDLVNWCLNFEPGYLEVDDSNG